MPYMRILKVQNPPMRGADVTELQQRLLDLGYSETGRADGSFGSSTEKAVRSFQQSHNLAVDGIVGPATWTALFNNESADTKRPGDRIASVLDELTKPHSYIDSVAWHLTPEGLVIGEASPETFGGEPSTVRRVWQNFSVYMEESSLEFSVPIELIIATICTESGGKPDATRKEPGYVSDEETPNRVSIGLTQTLISTARNALGAPSINGEWLKNPGNSIKAGTAYISSQWDASHFDPPKVACAYNAGGIYYNGSPQNRWKMRQYPINTSAHADRFIKWFNESFVMFGKDGIVPSVSFYRVMH